MSFGNVRASSPRTAATVASRGICSRLLRAAHVDLERLVVGVRRWWSITTDQEFLLHPASRRDLWRVLLPLPLLVLLISDLDATSSTGSSSGGLLCVDIAAAVLLLVAPSCLPEVDRVWADLVVATVYGVHVLLRSLLSPSGDVSFVTAQVMPVCGMAAAGIHSSVLGGFLVASAISRAVLAPHSDGEVEEQRQLLGPVGQLATLCYVIVVIFAVERRIAQLVHDSNANVYSYKALNLLSNHSGGQVPRPADDGRGNLIYYTDTGSTQPAWRPFRTSHGGGTGSGDEATALPATSVSSRSSLADYVLSKMLPDKRVNSVGDYVFSRLLEPSPEEEGSPGLDPEAGGPRLQGLQVCMPKAADHEAPMFRESSRTLRRKPADGEGPVGVESQPLTWQSPLPRPDLDDQREDGLDMEHLQTLRPGGERSRTCTRHSRSAVFPDEPPEEGASAAWLPQTPGTCITSPQTPRTTLQRLGSSKVSRAVKLTGFRNLALNELFVENREPEFHISGAETYWSYGGDYFLYRSPATNTWGAAKARRFAQVREGRSNGVAHSPEGFEIWQLKTTKKAWREWDTELRQWTARPGSGVESRGKVRKKDGPVEKAVQTEFQGEEKAVQVMPFELGF